MQLNRADVRKLREELLPDNAVDVDPRGDFEPALDQSEFGLSADAEIDDEQIIGITDTGRPARNDKDKDAKSPPLRWLDMSNWDKQPVPERQWAIRDRVPLNQAGLFSGEGGTGKSIIELEKDVAHVMAKDWLGSMPEPGPAFYLGAEDDKDEIHIRLAAIAKHHGVTFKD